LVIFFTAFSFRFILSGIGFAKKVPKYNLLIYLDFKKEEIFLSGDLPCWQGILPEGVSNVSQRCCW
jgi:hypothetical protein